MTLDTVSKCFIKLSVISLWCFVLCIVFIYMHICVSERDYWDSSLQIPTADFQEVLHDDKAALAWLEALRRIGIVYLRGAPAEQGQVARLSQRIGYLRLTFYGYGL